MLVIQTRRKCDTQEIEYTHVHTCIVDAFKVAHTRARFIYKLALGELCRLEYRVPPMSEGTLAVIYII